MQGDDGQDVARADVAVRHRSADSTCEFEDEYKKPHETVPRTHQILVPRHRPCVDTRQAEVPLRRARAAVIASASALTLPCGASRRAISNVRALL